MLQDKAGYQSNWQCRFHFKAVGCLFHDRGNVLKDLAQGPVAGGFGIGFDQAACIGQNIVEGRVIDFSTFCFFGIDHVLRSGGSGQGSGGRVQWVVLGGRKLLGHRAFAYC